MLYCETCMMLIAQDKCPACKKNKVREPKENDPVYLLTKHAVWASVVEDILRENGIPCLKRSEQTIVPTIIMGEVATTYRIFVPYGAYGASQELLADFLNEGDPEDFGDFVEIGDEAQDFQANEQSHREE